MPISASTRMAALTVAAILGLEVLASTPAAADPTPGVTDLYGRVLDNAGQPAAAISVSLFNAATGDYLTGTQSGANGVWNFDNLDTDAVTSYKIQFAETAPMDGEIAHRTVFFGQQYTLARAATVPEPPANGSTNVGDTRLTKFAGVTGTVSAPGFTLGDSPTDQVDVTAFNTDDREVEFAVVDLKPTNAIPDGSYFFDRRLLPGQTYKFRFYGQDHDPATGKYTDFVSEFYKTGSTFAQATPVTLGPPGSLTDVGAMTLTGTLKASQLPAIVGRPLVGRTLTVTPGVWNANANAEYSYRWLRGSTLVGTAAAYTPTRGDLSRPLQVEVTSRINDFIGTATSAPSARVKYGSKLAVKGKQATIRGRKAAVLTIDVRAAGLKSSKVAGKVVVTEKGRKVATGTVKDGRLLLTILDPGNGVHRYVVTYRGTRTIAGDKSTQKVSVT